MKVDVSVWWIWAALAAIWIPILVHVGLRALRARDKALDSLAKTIGLYRMVKITQWGSLRSETDKELRARLIEELRG